LMNMMKIRVKLVIFRGKHLSWFDIDGKPHSKLYPAFVDLGTYVSVKIVA